MVSLGKRYLVMSFDDLPEDPEASESAGNPPPRLGIIHLLAWITVAAVLFGIEKQAMSRDRGFFGAESTSFLYHGLNFVQLTAISAAVTGMAVLLRWQRRAHPAPFAPGHWMLIWYCLSSVSNYALSMFWRIWQRSLDMYDVRSGELLVEAVLVLIGAFQVIVLASAAIRYKSVRGWRRIFILFAICTGLNTVAIFASSWSLLFRGFAILGYVIAYPVFAIYSVRDFFRVRRDWLHGLGVAVVIIEALMRIGLFLTWRLIW
jgi:hypothetical protein